MSALLSLRNIHTGYGSREIVRGASLAVEGGEFCALLGLNGCGKTTLLRAACGLLPMKEGRCMVGETETTHLDEKSRARLMSYIPQRGSPIMGKTVLEVVLMGFNARLRLLDSPGEAHRRIAMEHLTHLGLAELAGRDYATLSEGQKQLVILARALSQDTPVMLMDESDSALDFVNRHMVLGKIRAVLHERQQAGLITLHDPNFALSYCDRLLLMQDGTIVTEIDMRNTDRATIEAALGIIYGEIAVLEYKDRYIMTRR